MPQDGHRAADVFYVEQEVLKTDGVVLSAGKGLNFEQLVLSQTPYVPLPACHSRAAGYLAPSESANPGLRRSHCPPCKHQPSLLVTHDCSRFRFTDYCCFCASRGRSRAFHTTSGYRTVSRTDTEEIPIRRGSPTTRIFKTRCPMIRHLLFDAVSILTTRLKKECALRQRALELAIRCDRTQTGRRTAHAMATG